MLATDKFRIRIEGIATNIIHLVHDVIDGLRILDSQRTIRAEAS